jgi:sortase A
MPSRRSADKLSTEELERLLTIRRREERLARFRRGQSILSEEESSIPKVEVVDTLSPVATPSPNALPVPTLPKNIVPYERAETLIHSEDDYGQVRFVEDDLFSQSIPKTKRKGSASKKKVFKNHYVNTFLFGLEIAAIAGLVIVLGVGFFQLGIIDQTKDDIVDTSNQTQRELEDVIKASRATAEPLPELTAVVLPGGHVWSENVSEIEFNCDEIPANIRSEKCAEVKSYRPIQQQEVPDAPRLIEIPGTKINHSIISGDDWYALQAAVGHQLGSGTPMSGKNMVLTAHNDIFGEIFKELPELKIGQEIYIETARGKYTYRITDAKQVEPNEVWVLGPEVADLTLITCYPYRVNTHRWVVFAELVQ